MLYLHQYYDHSRNKYVRLQKYAFFNLKSVIPLSKYALIQGKEQNIHLYILKNLLKYILFLLWL